MYLDLWGFWGFYSSVGLTYVPWLRRCFLVGEILFKSRILQSSFLIGLSWLVLSVVHKIFPSMLMCEGHVKPCQARQMFYYSLQLAWHVPSATYPRLPIQVITFGRQLTKKVLSSILGWDRQSYSVITHTTIVLVRLTTLLGSSSSSNMDKFTSVAKLLLSVALTP